MPQYQHDRPDSTQVLISRIVVTNNHRSDCSRNGSLSAHKAVLDKYKNLSLYNSTAFPNSTDDLSLISSGHLQYTNQTTEPATDGLEVMSIELEQFWMEFTGVKNSGSRPVSFLESFPVTVWVALPSEDIHTDVSNQGEMSVLVDIGAKICAQLNHYQYCFLMRLADSFTEMVDTIAAENKLHQDLLLKEDREGSLPVLKSATGQRGGERCTVPSSCVIVIGCLCFFILCAMKYPLTNDVFSLYTSATPTAHSLLFECPFNWSSSLISV